MPSISIEIFDSKSTSRLIATVDGIDTNDTILAVKKLISLKKHISVERIALRTDPRGKSLRDEDIISNLNLPNVNAQLFYRDLGPQIAWKTVFLLEYAGPLFIYPLFYFRPSFIYETTNRPIERVVTYAVICHSLHYAKRIYETQFIHRFSNGTMPIRNLFKNCTYYWGFSAFVSYFVNHPFYLSPTFGTLQIYGGLLGFLISELGNFSIHTLLRDLRPAGTKERKIPLPNSNPLTKLYNYVSCPNYTYEIAAWVSFTFMTQCLPAALFTLAGFIQMKIWAIGKHRAYKKEFPKYPKNRVSIIPFIC